MEGMEEEYEVDEQPIVWGVMRNGGGAVLEYPSQADARRAVRTVPGLWLVVGNGFGTWEVVG